MRVFRFAGVVGLLFLVACGSSPTGPIDPRSSDGEPTLLPREQSLSVGEQMRALAIRQRLARGNTAPTELVRRVFGRNGQVVREEVLTPQGFRERTSTIPRDLEMRSLSSFLVEEEVASFGSRLMATPVLRSHSWGGTINSTSVTIVDTVASNSAPGYEDFTSDVSDPDLSRVATVWYPDSSLVDELLESTGADVFVVEDGSVVGYEFVGEPWDWGRAQFIADTTGWGYGTLRMAAMSQQSGLVGAGELVGGRTGTVNHGHFASYMEFFMTDEVGPCDGLRLAYFGATTATVFVGIATAKACVNPITRLSGGCAYMKGRFEAATTVAVLAGQAYYLCLYENNQTMALRSLSETEWGERWNHLPG